MTYFFKDADGTLYWEPDHNYPSSKHPEPVLYATALEHKDTRESLGLGLYLPGHLPEINIVPDHFIPLNPEEKELHDRMRQEEAFLKKKGITKPSPKWKALLKEGNDIKNKFLDSAVEQLVKSGKGVVPDIDWEAVVIFRGGKENTLYKLRHRLNYALYKVLYDLDGCFSDILDKHPNDLLDKLRYIADSDIGNMVRRDTQHLLGAIRTTLESEFSEEIKDYDPDADYKNYTP